MRGLAPARDRLQEATLPYDDPCGALGRTPRLGSEREDGEQAGKDGAGNRSMAARTPSEGLEFIRFMKVLDSVAEPCVPRAPATVAPEPPDPGRPRTAPTPPPPLPGGPPAPDATGTPVDPRAEVALSGVEKCAASVTSTSASTVPGPRPADHGRTTAPGGAPRRTDVTSSRA
ncbi:hypothetical protein ADL02_44455 [Streptomyces sp. NRRL WC-3723]|nr:hypothetical protein ADL02_44455 [Streptomyces sp. NRRL WC-3723]